MANCIRSVPKFALDVSLKAEFFDLLMGFQAFDIENHGQRLVASLISGGLAAMISIWLLKFRSFSEFRFKINQFHESYCMLPA